MGFLLTALIASIIISKLDLTDFVKKLVKSVIEGAVKLVQHVVGYFQELKLRQGRDIPFIANETKLKIADKIHNAPVKNVHIFEATYNEDTEEIENYRSIAADEMDQELKNVLGKEELVVLT